MFSLILGFWRLFFRRTEFHILILGVDNAGKTVRVPRPPLSPISASSRFSCLCAALARQSLLERIKSIFTGLEPLPPGKVPPTVGLNIGRMQVNRTKLIFWDLGGATSLRSLWEKYYSEAHGLLYVVDASDAARFDESAEVLRALLKETPDLAGIPVLVLANKQDAPGAVTPHVVQARFGLQQNETPTGSSQPQNVLGVTALNGDGVEEGVRWLVDAVRSSPRAQALTDSEQAWGAPAFG